MSPATFTAGTDWEQSSGPIVNVDVQEEDTWPVDGRALAAKDQLAPGLHPLVAIGERAAPGRPLQVCGVVMSINLSVLGTGTDRVVLNIAHGFITRQYVSNILAHPDTYETTPVMGQPVFVDDSAALAAGVTLSMSPLNSAGTENPVAGVLWYCQDEIADGQVGGSRAASTFDVSLDDEEVEQEYCVMLVAGFRELA